MKTEIAIRPQAEAIDEEVVSSYDLTQAAIAELATKYAGLTIAGVEDKAGYAAVRAARMDIRDRRVAVDKRRKELKEGALEYGRKVDAVAKILTGDLQAIESRLDAEETRIDEEKARLAEEKRKAAAAKLQARVDALSQVGGVKVDLHTLGGWTDGQFDTYLGEKAAEWKAAEEKRLADEAAQEEARKAQAAERERLDAARREQEAKEAELRARQEELERKEREQAQKEREEQARKEGEARARAEAERREREEKERQERASAEERARAEEEARRLAAIEAARPDSQKLAGFAQALAAVALPEVTTDAGRKALSAIHDDLAGLCEDIRRAAAALVEVRPTPTTKAAAAAAPKGVFL